MGPGSGNDIQQQSEIISRARHGAALGQVRLGQGARRARDVATQRDNVPAGLVPEYAIEVGRRADGAAHIRTHLQGGHSGGKGGCGAAG